MENRDFPGRPSTSPKARKMAQYRRSAELGTDLAINRRVRVRAVPSKLEGGRPSAGPDNTAQKQCLGNGWGGARHRVVSTALTAKQVAALTAVSYRAITDGRPFNRMVTVHWGALGLGDSEAARATGRLVKLASDWCASKGVKMTWGWVRENDDGDGSKGSHVHLALHCPASLPIGRMWRRWLRRICKRGYARGAVRSRSIGPTLGTYATNPALYSENLCAVLAYMAKGVRPAEARALGIRHTEPTGRVIGKRAGWCQLRTTGAVGRERRATGGA